MRKFSLTFALKKKGFPGNPPLPCGSDTQIGPVFNPTHRRLSWLSLPVWGDWVVVVFLVNWHQGSSWMWDKPQHFSYYSSDASTRKTIWQCWDSKAKTTHIQNRWMAETSWTGDKLVGWSNFMHWSNFMDWGKPCGLEEYHIHPPSLLSPGFVIPRPSPCCPR